MNKHSLVLSLIKHLGRKPEILVVLTTLVFFFLLFIFKDSFKLGVIALLLVITLYYLISKNLFVSLFAAFVASVPFPLPSKHYDFEYASTSEFIFNEFPNGMLRSIDLTVSNLLMLLIIVFFLLEIVRRIIHIRSRVTHPFITMFNLPLFKYISLCWLGYYSISLYSSLYYSFFPMYSLYMLYENSKLFIGFIGIIYLLITKTKSVTYIYVILLTSLLFQNIVGVSQIVTSLSPLGYLNRAYSEDIEANMLLTRIGGLSGRDNIHAYIIFIQSILVLPYVLRLGGWLLGITALLSLVNLVLSQSRTAWLGLFIVVAYIFLIQKNEAKKFIITYLKGRYLYHVILLIFLMFLIMLPRLQISNLFFTEDGGGTLRLRMITEGWLLLQESPLVGFGVGNGVKVLLNSFPMSYAATFPFHIHFSFLQIALESGIPGAILFFLPFLVFLIKYARLPKFLRGLSKRVLLCTLCILIILFVNSAFQPALGMLEYYLIGIALGSGVFSLSKIKPDSYV